MRRSPNCTRGAARTREGDGAAARPAGAPCRRNQTCSRGEGPSALPRPAHAASHGLRVQMETFPLDLQGCETRAVCACARSLADFVHATTMGCARLREIAVLCSD